MSIKNNSRVEKNILKVMFVMILTILSLSNIFAEVDSTGPTRSMPMIDEKEVQQSLIYPGKSCSFNYSILSEEEVEQIRDLEKEVSKLSQEVNSIQKNAKAQFDSLYESTISQNRDEDNSNNWEEYSKKYEELQIKLGMTQRNERINAIQEELQEYFEGCYNSYDEEWILYKLSDEEKEIYKSLQNRLENSYDEESQLQDKHSNKYSNIYQESRNKSQVLEEELGITQIQEQIRVLQSQVNDLRDENKDKFNLIREEQNQQIEELEKETGLEEVREERESINREIQELTGNGGNGLPIMYAREDSNMQEEGVKEIRANQNEAVITNNQINSASEEKNLKSMCENNDGNWLEEFSQCEYITKTVCEQQMEGEFVECGSACRNDPNATICTKQCVPYCDVSNSSLRDGGAITNTNLSDDSQTKNKDVDAQNGEDSRGGIMMSIRNFFASFFTS